MFDPGSSAFPILLCTIEACEATGINEVVESKSEWPEGTGKGPCETPTFRGWRGQEQPVWKLRKVTREEDGKPGGHGDREGAT